MRDVHELVKDLADMLKCSGGVKISLSSSLGKEIVSQSERVEDVKKAASPGLENDLQVDAD